MSTPGPEALSEQELVERFRSGRENPYFAELYRRERRRVYGLCLKFLREPAAAEDVCHEAFVRAFERFDSLASGHFSAWVRRIAANLSINRMRLMANTTQAMPKNVPAADPDPDRRAVSHEELAAAIDLIRALDQDQRRAFVMFHLEGLSYEGIAARTGLPLHTVRSHLQNARRNLQLRWAETPHAGEERAHE